MRRRFILAVSAACLLLTVPRPSPSQTPRESTRPTGAFGGVLNDTERLFIFRAFWFARGFDSPLPSFDQNIAAAAAAADERSWKSHLDEFRSVRGATLAFFRNLPADAWARSGIASGNPFTVRALAYIAAGHNTHHVSILRSRYL